jgi:LmbE family N-acetylglucosaminyl deacetylase
MGAVTTVTRCVVRSLIIALFLKSLSTDSFAQFPPAPGTGPGLAETIEAIDAARVTTRILYVTAHPDDESAAVLTYLARGLHADVALLSLTRGEGGQNALGPEQAPQLGLIRTQELLAATRGYGVKLYFTRAKDFGFSKTPEETMKVWGDEVLLDMVRVIRTFRPDIVINGWGGVHSGHGHHQAAGLLTPMALKMAQDPTHQECMRCGDLLSIPVGGVLLLDLDRFSEHSSGYAVPVDEVSPLYGKTWREIGLDAFLNHRTQGVSGFLTSPFLSRPIALRAESDGKALTSGLPMKPLGGLAEALSKDGCGTTNALTTRLKIVDATLEQSRSEALSLHWKEAVQLVARAAQSFHLLNPSNDPSQPKSHCGTDIEVLDKLWTTEAKLSEAVKIVAGLQIEAEADRSEIATGDQFKVRVRTRCRPQIDCKIGSLALVLPDGMKEVNHNKEAGGAETFAVAVDAPPQADLWINLQAEEHPLVEASVRLAVGEYEFMAEQSVTHISATSTRVDRVPLRIVPVYTLTVEPKQDIEVLARQRKPFDVLVRVHSYSTKTAEVSVGLDVPEGWTSSVPVETKFAGIGDRYVKLSVTPPKTLAPGNYRLAAYAKRGDEKFTTSLEPLPSMPTQFWEEPAQCVVHAFDVKVPEGLRVGYITAESEPIPESLRMLGIQVETLDATALNFSDLKKFDAIVVGVRAYELRPELPGANQRLLDYVTNGGTLVVQYNRDVIWDKLQPGPYPALVSPPIPPAKDGAPQTPRPLPRITDENSPVKFLKPEDSLLNSPNKVTQEDFKGWVQERGLYYWTEFDPKYTPLLSMHDPGEPDLNGGMVYTHLGKGTYIYTGLAFFRQLPEGVPGAYRLFVNLLSASRNK